MNWRTACRGPESPKPSSSAPTICCCGCGAAGRGSFCFPSIPRPAPGAQQGPLRGTAAAAAVCRFASGTPAGRSAPKCGGSALRTGGHYHVAASRGGCVFSAANTRIAGFAGQRASGGRPGNHSRCPQTSAGSDGRKPLHSAGNAVRVSLGALASRAAVRSGG